MSLATRFGAWTIRRPLLYDAIVIAAWAGVLGYIGFGEVPFWGLLAAFVAARVVFEIAYAVHCRRRGTRPREVRAGLADRITQQATRTRGEQG